MLRTLKPLAKPTDPCYGAKSGPLVPRHSASPTGSGLLRARTSQTVRGPQLQNSEKCAEHSSFTLQICVFQTREHSFLNKAQDCQNPEYFVGPGIPHIFWVPAWPGQFKSKHKQMNPQGGTTHPTRNDRQGGRDTINTTRNGTAGAAERKMIFPPSTS